MPSSSDSPRTLTQMLREWDDAALSELLLNRPDLAFPPPRDLTQIASRATTRLSVSSALDTLNAFELEVARRASALPAGFSATDLHGPTLAGPAPAGTAPASPALAGPAPAGMAPVSAARDEPTLDEAATSDALHRLRGLALVWGPPTALRPVRALSSLLAEDRAATLTPAHPPDFPNAPRQSPGLVDKVAAGSAFEFVRRIEVLVEHCDHVPVRLLRTGGLANREVKTIAALLDVPAALATMHLEVAERAGLLGLAAHRTDEVLLPTAEFDDWLDWALADQWAGLVGSWLEAHDESGPSWLKRLCLDAFGAPTEGRVLSATDLRAWVAWHRPRQVAGTHRQVATLLDQSSWVGVTGLGAIASFAPRHRHRPQPHQRQQPQPDSTTLAGHLPTRSEQVVVQADLTAVAPGPLTAAASRDLGTLADVESRGGATVYRFTAESLTRALDLGWDPDEILSTLHFRSRTALPQPLRYLIQDLARRRTEAVAAPKPASHHLSPPRALARSRVTEQSAGDRLQPEDAVAIVSQLRQAEALNDRSGDPDVLRTPQPVVASLIDTLREAGETGEVIWISVVDAGGRAGERLVRAVEVDDGQLHARDERCGDVISVPVGRITAAHILRTGR